MPEYFANGDVVIFILAIMCIELIVLILVRKKIAVGVKPVEHMVSIGAGAALLLALREAERQAIWQHVAVWLIVALVFHLWDLKLRLAAHRTA